MKLYPLSDSFVAISFLGFVWAVLFTNSGKLSPTWGTTMIIFFIILVIASLATIRAAADRSAN